MSYTIAYERLDGTSIIQRDDYHTDSEPLLTAYNTDDNGDVVNKVQMPISRVVRIDSR